MLKVEEHSLQAAQTCVFRLLFFLISESQKVGKGESFFFFDYAKKTVETVCYLYLDFK